MTGKDIFLSLGEIEDKYIDTPPRAKGGGVVFFRWLTIAASLCLLIVTAIFSARFFTSSGTPDGGIGGVHEPDKAYFYKPGETIECVCGSCRATLTDIILTDTLGDVSATDGGYLVFTLELKTDHHFLLAEFIYLNTPLLSHNDYSFNKELSERLSTVSRPFDKENTVLYGTVSLVFKIKREAYSRLTESQSAPGEKDKILLYPDIAWCGGYCYYKVGLEDIKLKTE